MPKSVDKAESRMLEAYTAAKREQKPNVSKIARENGVSRRTFHNRVENGMQAHTCRKPVYKALKGYQEEALKQWAAPKSGKVRALKRKWKAKKWQRKSAT
ncbi:hypothetical protein NUU61_001847 [Penicillium alfredii]|uniref:HTH psq-type domain-containing protein n=1 Tax=Penicillium alfredii TaxID=1506179 RepID=A0A9W9FQG7_9EURO|nr:uncharacterized protein NUU61_001847 [Penicillium alfredii]KAJ5104500.1 hypothetical protein NUU61_001847 [Penicillium alfredii]